MCNPCPRFFCYLCGRFIPLITFKEEKIKEGEFPTSKAGKKFFKEFINYTKARGPSELMHSAVFKGTDNSKEKRAREYLPAAK
jgi:hypothetical protein